MSNLSALAVSLYQAENSKTTVPPLLETHTDLTIDEAYQVQFENVDRRLAGGDTIAGFKVGLTSIEVQKHFGISHPDVGHLYQSWEIADGGTSPLNVLIQPKVEGEIAFLMAKDIQSTSMTAKDLAEFIESVMVSIEVIDSRIADWKIRAQDTVADNASSARYVLGEKRIPVGDIDLTKIGVVLRAEGELLGSGASQAVMGNPLEAVAFLVNELGRFDRGLKKGQVVLSGSVTPMFSPVAGVRYEAEALGLGKVAVKFS